MKNIYILGATGTIGTQTIEIVNMFPNKFKVVGLSLGYTNKENHEQILKTLNPEVVCLRESDKDLENKFKKIKFYYGDKGLLQLVKYPKKGMVVTGISGSAGLLPTIEAIKSGKNIALANKETMVMAGKIVKDLINEYKVELIPVDSEHHGVYNCLLGENTSDVKSITITASGGSFRDLTKEELEKVTLEDALKHPNWNMGPKITIDSATMVNKGLEVIEAHHLFDLKYDQIKTVLHKQSIVHAFVEYKDNSVKALLSSPDMKLAIGYALAYPNKIIEPIEVLDLTKMDLSFKKMDYNRYPLLKLAYEVGNKGGLYPVVYNAANEAAVKLFLNEKIKFLDIEKIVFNEIETFNNNIENPTLEEVIETNKRIIRKVLDTYEYNS